MMKTEEQVWRQWPYPVADWQQCGKPGSGRESAPQPPLPWSLLLILIFLSPFFPPGNHSFLSLFPIFQMPHFLFPAVGQLHKNPLLRSPTDNSLFPHLHLHFPLGRHFTQMFTVWAAFEVNAPDNPTPQWHICLYTLIICNASRTTSLCWRQIKILL